MLTDEFLTGSEKMGRKIGSMYISPKRFGSLQKPCLKETITFLNCMALNNCKDDQCERQKKLLSDCMDAQVIEVE